MAALKEQLFAFNKKDADAILSDLPPVGGGGIPDRRAYEMPIILGQVKSGGLAANSTGFVWYMEPIVASPFWAVTSTEYPVFNFGPAIAANTYVLLFAVNGRWFVVGLC
jgi:hypothetical protein